MLGRTPHHVKLMIAGTLAGLWIVPSVDFANGEEPVKSVEQLIVELRDSDVHTRQFAALGLGKSEAATEAAIEALLGALRDGDRAVRTSARYALAQAGPKAAAALNAYEEQRLARLSAKLTDPTFDDLQGATVELKRSDCGEDGTRWLPKPCPAYSVRLHGDGAVLYEGQRHVKTLGKQAGLVTFEALRELMAEFGRAGFLTMEDRYEQGAEKELRMLGDIGSYPRPFVTTTLTIDGETKTVSRYAGTTEEVPNALLELEASIDRAAGTTRWVE